MVFIYRAQRPRWILIWSQDQINSVWTYIYKKIYKKYIFNNINDIDKKTIEYFEDNLLYVCV